jgi:uncharacterized protein YutE (UPF0331/DUF86 family)
MPERPPRRAERGRWRDLIIAHLKDFPRQYAALESAMSTFGDDFDLSAFKAAFETTDDMEAYNRVQAVERGIGRVQNFIGDLAEAGVKLAELPRPPMGEDGSRAEQAFRALRDGGVIDGHLCRRLVRAHGARRSLEHRYLRINAADVHRAAELVHGTAPDFIRAYRRWIEPLLRTHSDPPTWSPPNEFDHEASHGT